MDFRKLTGGFAVQQVEKGSATSGIWKLQQVEKDDWIPEVRMI